MHINFLTTSIVSLFYCCKKVFILMNIWMIQKISMRHSYLKKKIFTIGHAMEIINFLKNETINNEQQKSYENTRICYICKKRDVKINMLKIKNIVKDHSHDTGEHRSVTHSICNFIVYLKKFISMDLTTTII